MLAKHISDSLEIPKKPVVLKLEAENNESSNTESESEKN